MFCKTPPLFFLCLLILHKIIMAGGYAKPSCSDTNYLMADYVEETMNIFLQSLEEEEKKQSAQQDNPTHFLSPGTQQQSNPADCLPGHMDASEMVHAGGTHAMLPYAALNCGYTRFPGETSYMYFLRPTPYHFLPDPETFVFCNGALELCPGLARALYGRDLPAVRLQILTDGECMFDVATGGPMKLNDLFNCHGAYVPDAVNLKINALAFVMYALRILHSARYHGGLTGPRYAIDRHSTYNIKSWVAALHPFQPWCVQELENFILSMAVCSYTTPEQYVYFTQMCWLSGIYLLLKILFFHFSFPLCRLYRMELCHRLKILFGVSDNSHMSPDLLMANINTYEECILAMTKCSPVLDSHTLWRLGVPLTHQIPEYANPDVFTEMLTQLVCVENVCLAPLHTMRTKHCFYYRYGDCMPPMRDGELDASVIPNVLSSALGQQDCTSLHTKEEHSEQQG
ncbi:ORF143 [Ranid herpesvirus 2]|uniref:ORF143 n=1 Tax=Ranid herpesvirus 2 TaxID=389214 RepID=Q14VW3_9VIRU|nr:ORF143 [Ranid herpesvirus 2]ABG25605.1 ORF143 [Ranid herpesvirus 2]